MDEFLSEAEQWERAKGWLRSYAGWILGGVVVALGGISGWNWWQDRQDRLGLEASAKYEQMTAALVRNDLSQAKAISADLERDYPNSPYVDQAHLFDARLAVEASDLAKAETLLRGIMEHSKDDQLALIARLRLARVQLAQNKPDDALATLSGKPAGASALRSLIFNCSDCPSTERVSVPASAARYSFSAPSLSPFAKSTSPRAS